MIIELDLALITWVLALNAAVYFIKQSGITEGCCIPLTVIEFVLALAVGIAWGFVIEGFTAEALLSYGIPNGLWLGLVACAVYDGVHGFVKKKEVFLKLLATIKGFFTKKKKEEKA